MHRLRIPLGMLLLSLAVAVSDGGPVPPLANKQRVVEPLGQVTETAVFEGGKCAVIIASAKGFYYMGLYVYDADGNCVAKDDHGNFDTCDDMAVEFHPPETARYTWEVRNFGPNSRAFIQSAR